MKVAIICTGGKLLGYGHFMRSKAFARVGIKSGYPVLLLPIAEEEDDHLFDEFQDHKKVCRSADDVITAVDRFKPQVIVWDTVDCSDELIDALTMRVAQHVSISPVFRHMGRMNKLFTRVIDTPPIGGVEISRGLKYAMFSENCSVIPDEIYLKNLGKEHLTVGISMGGADAPNKTLAILKSIVSIPISMTIWVMLGEGYRHSYEDLVAATKADKRHEVILAKTNRSMWDVLSNCNLAILAGGLMMIEAVYAGLPSANIFEKPLHERTAGTELFEAGAAVSMGVMGPQSLSKLNEWLTECSARRSRLLACRECTRGKIDRLAPVRIYEEIRESIPLASVK